ncbi:MAG: hypothetical protein AB1705_11245 [Verrucomicrobiota bacterium]
MQMHNQLLGNIRYQTTGIDALDELLDSANGLEVRQERSGIAYFDKIGYFGVIFGAAGSGKSILGVQLSCSFVSRIAEMSAANDRSRKRCAVYLTQEDPGLIYAKIRDFGFLDGSCPIYVEGMRVSGSGAETDQGFHEPGLHILQMPLEVELQRHKLENIFNALAQAIPRKDDKPSSEFFVCIDNAETIEDEVYLSIAARGASAEQKPNAYGVKTRKDQNFFKLLRAHCAGLQINSFFIFEEKGEAGVGAENRDLSTTAQAYAADIVIRLGMHIFPTGYKERTIEILKAKNQYYRRGRHHFSIVGQANRDENGAVGIVIYPSMATQLYKSRSRQAQSGSPKELENLPRCTLGIPELDGRIATELRLTSHSGHVDGYLEPGTVTVLVSDLDIRANDIALHFAFQNIVGDQKPPLYLSLVHQQNTLSSALKRFKLFEKGPTLERYDPRRRAGNFHHFAPEHISEGKLIRDISAMVGLKKDAKGRRIVVDNLFGIKARWPLIQDVHHFLATLFSLFRERQVVALVVDMVEVGEGRNPIGESFAAGLADNVFTLRHVELHSKAHTAFSVIKLLGKGTPTHLWDIAEERADNAHGGLSVLRARDTFAFYRNMLTGSAEPVGITLSLHADCEGSPLDEFLKVKHMALSQPSGRVVHLHRYLRDQYSHFQNSLILASAHPLSDSHIISVDETWIEQLLENDLLEEIGEYLKDDEFKRWQFDNRAAYVTAAQDLAFTYLSKTRGLPPDYGKWYLVPDRNNCGVLCFDEDAWGSVLKDNSGRRLVERVMGELGPLPRPGRVRGWVKRIGAQLRWRHIVTLQRELATSETYSSDPGVFTFCMDQMESCASFLIELALSDKAGKRLVGKDRRLDFVDNVRWRVALVRLLELLDNQEIAHLASGKFRQSIHEARFLFSRQWFSTWGTHRFYTENGHQSGLRNLILAELPKGDGKSYPTPVSGAWYLGILKGSVAVRAGVQIIKQFTSDEDNLFKANRGIGLPVRRSWYERKSRADLHADLPYRKQFAKIADAQAEIGSKRGRAMYSNRVMNGDFPFYRMHIKNYDAVAPILWGMMVEAARANLNRKPSQEPTGINEILKSAQKRYKVLMELRESERKSGIVRSP